MLTLSLVTPSKKIFTDLAVDEVFVPAYRGELNILEGHGPLMSTLDIGVLRYKVPGETSYHDFVISWGYLEVSHDRITVLAETAEHPSEIDVERAREAKARAEKALSRADLEQHEFQKYQLKLQRALVRLERGQDNAAVSASEKK